MRKTYDEYLQILTGGCEAIQCENPYCAHCPRFLFQRSTINEKKQMALQFSQLPDQTNVPVCATIQYEVLHPEAKNSLATFNQFVSQFLDLPPGNPKDIIRTIRPFLFSYDFFPKICLSNDLPLSLYNSAINDDLMFEFAGKLSSIPTLNMSILDIIHHIAKTLIGDDSVPQYKHIRALLLLFYFPAVISPSCAETQLNALLIYIVNLPSVASSLLKQWLSVLPKLLSQMVGDVHFAISAYFSTHINPDPHSHSLREFIHALGILHDANMSSPNPLPPSRFYNHHIDELVDPQTEFQLSQNRRSFHLLETPYVLSLEKKAKICQMESEQMMGATAFHSMILSTIERHGRPDFFMTLRIRRDHLLDDAIAQLLAQDAMSFLKKLKVVFEGESAVDAGGPSREFLYAVSEQLMSPDLGMFKVIDNRYHWFVQQSFEGGRSYFLVGAVVGLAVHNSIVLPVRFPLTLYKRLLTPKSPLTLVDLGHVDKQMAESLQMILEMAQHGEDISELTLTFDATIEVYGEPQTVPLIRGGSGIEVTNENVAFYVQSYVNFLLVESIKNSFDAFKRGFELACREVSYRYLEPAELDILVSGEEVYDWGALKRSTTYSDGYTERHKAVIWFWQIFDELTDEEKKNFLRFSTGTDRAPLGGLGNVQLVIQKGADTKRLPVSHTCFNTFTLPDYRSKKLMKDRILLAIQHTEGFGFV